MVRTLANCENTVLGTLVSWVRQVSGAGWGLSFGCVAHQQTLIQAGSSLSAECPVNPEVWGGSPRTHIRLTDPLAGHHWWPPLIPEALARKEPLGNTKTGPKAVLNYVTWAWLRPTRPVTSPSFLGLGSQACWSPNVSASLQRPSYHQEQGREG